MCLDKNSSCFSETMISAGCTLGLLVASLVATPDPARAQRSREDARPTYRSPAQLRHNQPDERSRPRSALLATRHGWLFQSDHFQVFATTSANDAMATANRLETVWSEIDALASHWTNVHREPRFRPRPLGVAVVDQRNDRRVVGASAEALGNDLDILLELPSNGPSLDEQLPQLREDTFLSFMRITGQDRRLPEWVSVGLAEWYARKPEPEASTDSPNRPAEQAAVGRWHSTSRSNQPNPPVDRDARKQRLEAAAWVRYLLEADDARHAPQFLDALRRATLPDLPLPESHAGLARLTNDPSVWKDFPVWVTDPAFGQPTIQPTPAEMSLDRRHMEMILVLKLTRRFGSRARNVVQPRVWVDGKQQTAPANVASIVSLSDVRRRLTDPSVNDWATLDTDGRLLLSGNGDRLDQLFRPTDRTYRTFLRDGHLILQASFSGGRIFEAWMEENPDNPRSPIARVQVARSRSPQP